MPRTRAAGCAPADEAAGARPMTGDAGFTLAKESAGGNSWHSTGARAAIGGHPGVDGGGHTDGDGGDHTGVEGGRATGARGAVGGHIGVGGDHGSGGGGNLSSRAMRRSSRAAASRVIASTFAVR